MKSKHMVLLIAAGLFLYSILDNLFEYDAIHWSYLALKWASLAVCSAGAYFIAAFIEKAKGAKDKGKAPTEPGYIIPAKPKRRFDPTLY